MIANEMGEPRVTMDQAISRGSFHIEETVTKPGTTRGRTEVSLFVQLGEDRPRYPATFEFREVGPRQEPDGSAQTPSSTGGS